MVTWKFKGCPRCKGDIFIDQETDGWYEHCLLCGYVREIKSAAFVSKDKGGVEKKESGRDKQPVLLSS